MKPLSRTAPAFPRLRMVMLLFMIFSLLSPLWQDAGAQTNLASFQDPNGQLCHDLDKDDNLVLSETEAGALAGDPYNYTDEQIVDVANYCEGLPSMSADEIAGEEEPVVNPVQESARVGIQAILDVDAAICADLYDLDLIDGDGTAVATEAELVASDFADYSASILAGDCTAFGPFDEEADGRVPICHATESATNQYVIIKPSRSSYDTHLAHIGIEGGDRYATAAEQAAGRCFNDAVVSFVKYFCTVNDLVAPPPVIGTPGQNCALATDEVFTLSIDGQVFTTAELLAGVSLPPGEYDLYEGETFVGTVSITVTGTTLTFNVLNYVADPMFQVVVEKYFCTVNELEAPAPVIGVPGDNCDLATDQVFTLSIDGQTFTTAELLAGVMLAPGTYDLYEGTTLVGTITVVDANQTVTVLNYVAEPMFEVVIEKYFCTVNELEAPVPVIGVPGDNCDLATDQVFTLSIDGQTFTTAELLAGVMLAPGTYDLYEGETLVGTITVVDVDQVVTVLNYVAEPEGTVIVHKWFCIDESLEGPTVVGDDYEFDFEDNCVAGTADFDILDSEGVSLGLDLTLLFHEGVQLPAGDYTLVEYDGETVVLSFDFTIDPTETEIIMVVNPVDVPVETGQIAVFKTLCERIGQQDTCNGRDDLLEGYTVNFNIYEGSDDTGTLVETVTVTLGENAGGGGNTGSGSQGRIVSGELPLGTYTVCEVEIAYGPGGEEVPLQAVPRPDASGGGSSGGGNQSQFGEDCITVELTPGIAELKFLDLIVEVEPEVGTILVVKYFCEDADITVPVVGDDDSDYDDCTLASAEQLEGVNFWVFPFGEEADAIDVDDTLLLTTGVELPVGTHTLVEVVDGVAYELATVTVTDGSTITYAVFNPIEMEEITLNLYKFVCSGFSEKHEDGCVESDELDGTEIEFTVTYTIGDVETTVETSVVIDGSEGTAVLTLPLADSYTVCEITPEGVEALQFAVGGIEDVVADEDGCITFSGEGLSGGDILNVMFWNDMVDKTPEKPEKPEKPVKPVKPVKNPAVTNLPNTGTGEIASSSSLLWAATVAMVAFGVGALGIRRKNM